MIRNILEKNRYLYICISLAFSVLCVPLARGQERAGTVDIFMGVDFNYRDIMFNDRVFDLLINLTPGVKWQIGHRWEASAAVIVPVFNQYGDYYKYVRLYNATVSKQLPLFGRWRVKVTGGVFGSQRYGLDIKNMVIVNDWLAVTAQVGLTGYLSMSPTWTMSKMSRVSGFVGPEIYLGRWNTQLSVRGGRYAYGDYGVTADAMRHFRHVTVGVYASYNEVMKENVGFSFTMMLPPYKRHSRKVNFRPASNFVFSYSSKTDNYANRKYITDPEENQREGWFDRDMLPWGPDLMEPDFVYADKSSGKRKEGE